MYENEIKNEEPNYNMITKELSKFNWGAFGLGPIWAIFNGAFKDYWIWFVAALICIFCLKNIPVIGRLFLLAGWLGIPIYVGMKGNNWSWYGKKWNDIQSFSKVQVSWAIGAVIAIILGIIINIAIVGSVIFKGIGMVKEEGGVLKFTHMVMIKPLVTSPEWKNATSGEDYVNKAIKTDHSLKKYNKDTVLVTSDKGTRVIMTLYKDGDCKLEKKNCYILSNSPDIQSNITVKTYFDNNGKMNHIVLKDFQKAIPTEKEFLKDTENENKE